MADNRQRSASAIVRVALAGLVALALFSAHAATIMTETWDSATPPSTWPYKQAPSACDAGWQGNIFNGWNPEVAEYCTGFSSWAQCGIVTTPVAPGATRSFKAYHDQTQGAETCDISKDIPAPYKDHIFLQVYVWFDPDFIGFNTPTSSFPEGAHFLFTNQACSGCGLRVNLYAGVPYNNDQCKAGSHGVPSNQPYMFFSIQDNSHEWGTNNAGTHTYTNGDYGTVGGQSCYNLLAHTGEWLKVQFEFDIPNQRVRIWVNDSLKYTGTDVISQSDFHWLMLANYGPSVLDTTTATTKTVYYGPLTIADAYITAGSGVSGSISAIATPLGTLTSGTPLGGAAAGSSTATGNAKIRLPAPTLNRVPK